MLVTFKKQPEEHKASTAEELREYILNKASGQDDLSEEEKAEQDAQIMSKLKCGKGLTPKELSYLQNRNPVLYIHAMRVQVMAKTVKEQLKHAKSEEQANQIVSCAMSGIAKEDLAREYKFVV